MASASRTRHASRSKPRAATSGLTALVVMDALRTWVIPAAASVVIVAAAALSAADLVSTPGALAVAIFGVLVLLLYVGERPLLDAGAVRRDQALGALLGLVWLAALYLPFHARIFPGRLLLDGAEVSATGQGLPLHIPAAGVRRLDVEIEGKLPHAPSGAALPVTYSVTLEDAAHRPTVLSGRFDETLKSQRLGRRGSTVVHQQHESEMHLLANPPGEDVTVTRVTLEPDTAPPLMISAFAHPLPGTFVLALASLALVGAVVAFDRRGLAATDGALTLSTAAVIGAAIVFWTSNAAHPSFQTLVGSAIFGGPLGFIAGAIVWWIAKRAIAAPAR